MFLVRIEINFPSKSSLGILIRYTRQMLLTDIGLAGQMKIKNARVLVIGAGGIGSSVLMSLAGMGTGWIGIVENDVVEISNLHRQTIHTVLSVNKSKALSAKLFIEALNPFCHVELHDIRINQTNALGIVGQYDIVIDGCDNATTRYIVNDACVVLNVELEEALDFWSCSKVGGPGHDLQLPKRSLLSMPLSRVSKRIAGDQLSERWRHWNGSCIGGTGSCYAMPKTFT